MNFVNLSHPVSNIKLAAGKLLIAEPMLGDTNFSRSVILLCEHGSEGSVGFVLNHATTLTLGDLLPELYTPSLSIYKGGPVQEDTLHMIHRIPEKLGGNKIATDVFWGGSYEALQRIITENDYQPGDMRLFVGYSGWSPGQLERELEEGSWIVSNMSEDLLFDVKPENVWKEAINRLGKNYAYLANMPTDPQLN